MQQQKQQANMAAQQKDEEFRVERDTMGELRVPASSLYGAQTARSLIYFAIGHDTMPRAMIRAFGLLKKVRTHSPHVAPAPHRHSQEN
jgi:aspartate ammonia-lyase